jgi:TPR repeat protein
MTCTDASMLEIRYALADDPLPVSVPSGSKSALRSCTQRSLFDRTKKDRSRLPFSFVKRTVLSRWPYESLSVCGAAVWLILAVASVGPLGCTTPTMPTQFSALREAAERGDPPSQVNLGYRYERGDGLKQDAVEAVKWYRRAAEQGYPEGQFDLAVCYQSGTGSERDLHQAFAWYRKAADQGLAAAQYGLAYCYSFGNGVDVNQLEATKWYRKAAEQGLASAQLELCNIYFIGIGVDKDQREALKWCRLAADQGNSDAAFILGSSYLAGAGVDKDPRKGVEWLRKSAEHGNAAARKLLNDIRNTPWYKSTYPQESFLSTQHFTGKTGGISLL